MQYFKRQGIKTKGIFQLRTPTFPKWQPVKVRQLIIIDKPPFSLTGDVVKTFISKRHYFAGNKPFQ